MASYRTQLIFFIVLVGAVLAVNFFIFKPYFSAIFLAIILSIAFEPIHIRFLKFFKEKVWLASLISVIVILLLILVPLASIGFLLIQESTNLYSHLIDEGGIFGYLDKAVNSLDLLSQKFFPNSTFKVSETLDFKQYLEKLLVWVSSNFRTFFSSFFRGVMGLLIMILALFYFFKDGKRFIESLIAKSPLADKHDQKILKRLKVAINSVVRGQLTVGIIQGILTGVGFWIFGIPNAVLWGVVAAIAALVPTFGTGLIIAPAVIILFLASEPLRATGLFFWGVIAVGLIDNILGPMLIEKGVKIHPFIILMSVLGGIGLFGPIGFIAGPVFVSLLFALLDLYPTIIWPTKTNES